MSKQIRISDNAYKLLLRVKGEKLAKGEKTTYSDIIEEALKMLITSTTPTSIKKPTNEDVREMIKEAVKSVDAQKEKFEIHPKNKNRRGFWEVLNREVKVIRERLMCECGGEIVRTMALKSPSETGGEVVHRVLATCTNCKQKYLMKLDKVRPVEEVKLKDRIMDWKNFKETVEESGVKEEWFQVF